jgi:hypothetical protein
MQQRLGQLQQGWAQQKLDKFKQQGDGGGDFASWGIQQAEHLGDASKAANTTCSSSWGHICWVCLLIAVGCSFACVACHTAASQCTWLLPLLMLGYSHGAFSSTLPPACPPPPLPFHLPQLPELVPR